MLIPGNLLRRVKVHIKAPKHDFFVVYPPGFEKQGVRELEFAGVTPSGITETGGVMFSGSIDDLYRVTLSCRGAVRVLMRVDTFKATGFSKLSRKISSIPWELYLPPATKPVLKVTASKSRLYHTDAVNERVMKSIEERVSAYYPAEEIVVDESIKVFIRLSDDKVTVSLDCSGDPLYMRGYKKNSVKAPIRENIASLLISGFFSEMKSVNDDTKTKIVIDPMCGSGTFPIEAAILSGFIDTVNLRSYPFEKWPVFSKSSFEYIKRKLLSNKNSIGDVKIFGSDINESNIKAAVNNSLLADPGCNEYIEFKVKNFFTLKREDYPDGEVYIIMNPPYGKRVGEKERIEKFYKNIGIKLRRDFKGANVAILIPSEIGERVHGLGYCRKIHFLNGGLSVNALFMKL